MNNKDQEIYLGLDVSTKMIGVCLLADDGSEHGHIMELTHINPKIPKKVKGIEQLFAKKRVFEDFIEKYKDIGIDHVIIEEPLISSNNSITVSTLLRFNGMISDCIYNVLGIVPDYISSYDARKYSFPDLMSIRKYGKNEEPYPFEKILKNVKKGNVVLFGGFPWTVDKKAIIQDKVSDLFPDIQWIYDKNGNLKKENFDATDSYVCVIGFINKTKKGELIFTTENVKVEPTLLSNKTISFDLKYWDVTEKRKIHID